MVVNLMRILIILAVVISPGVNFASGHLLIIGGGERPPAVIQKFVQLAGAENAKIVIIPVASSIPYEVADFQRNQFLEAGAGKVDFIVFDHQSADRDSNLNAVDTATAIFFSGGVQRRLTKALLSTRLLEKIRQVYRNGGVIGGTSAGAAVMSELMITGTELINQDSTRSFNSIKKANIETIPGFGFIEEAIIDQHFIARKRHNRLISLVLENRQLIGIGIDESTAILVYPDRIFEVIGDRTVMIFDPTQIDHLSLDESNNFAFSGMVVHVLKSGERYNLKSRTLIR
jgi:cyanophycinase